MRLGLVIRSSLRHCSIGRSTAASTPRLVTICGPSARAVSRSSLNLDLASWTGHLLLMIYTNQLNMTSCKTSLQGHSMSSEPGCGPCFNLADFGSRSSLASSVRGTSSAVPRLGDGCENISARTPSWLIAWLSSARYRWVWGNFRLMRSLAEPADASALFSLQAGPNPPDIGKVWAGGPGGRGSAV